MQNECFKKEELRKEGANNTYESSLSGVKIV